MRPRPFPQIRRATRPYPRPMLRRQITRRGNDTKPPWWRPQGTKTGPRYPPRTISRGRFRIRLGAPKPNTTFRGTTTGPAGIQAWGQRPRTQQGRHIGQPIRGPPRQRREEPELHQMMQEILDRQDEAATRAAAAQMIQLLNQPTVGNQPSTQEGSPAPVYRPHHTPQNQSGCCPSRPNRLSSGHRCSLDQSPSCHPGPHIVQDPDEHPPHNTWHTWPTPASGPSTQGCNHQPQFLPSRTRLVWPNGGHSTWTRGDCQPLGLTHPSFWA